MGGGFRALVVGPVKKIFFLRLLLVKSRCYTNVFSNLFSYVYINIFEKTYNLKVSSTTMGTKVPPSEAVKSST